MTPIRLIAETEETITIARADYERLLDMAEDAEDVATLRAAVAREDRLGSNVARADNLPVELVVRLIGGEHPVRIWREFRNLTPQALAAKADVGRSYIAEIESGKKPGSIAAFRKLAEALGVSIDDLASAA